MENPWTLIYNLQYEQNIIRDKYDKLLDIVDKLLAALRESEMKHIQRKEFKKKSIKCKFYNRGYCKQGFSCEFFHPDEICEEFANVGTCSGGEHCLKRHPRKCRYWCKGVCFRGPSCAYQHQEIDRQVEHEVEEGPNNHEPQENINDNEKDTDENDETTGTLDETSQSFNLEEIMKMYEIDPEKDFAVNENVDIEQIEDALARSEYLPKHYKDVGLKTTEKTMNVRKSSRKRLKSRN